MEHRLFIAINLPDAIKASIRDIISRDRKQATEWHAKARMIDEADWHITLKFLGAQPEDRLDAIMQAIEDTARQTLAPSIIMNAIATAPSRQRPSMLWAITTAETNQALGLIERALEHALAKEDVHWTGKQHLSFNGHVTLARIREGADVVERMTSFPHALSFRPTTIDLMESHPERSDAKYSILKSIDFKQAA